MWWGIELAKAAKIAVWWVMNDCPIPEGYDARRVRPSLEGAFKELGYSGPVSITAYGDQTQTPGHLLQGLSSTGVAVAHTRSESTVSLMYEDMVEWRGHNAPPATMMIISDQVKGVFSWDLAQLQQRTQYNLFLAYSMKSEFISVLLTSAEWLWEKLLGSRNNNKIETRSAPLLQDKCSETETRGRNYTATPEYATTKILVWWDMFDCLIPKGYDARRVRPSLEAAFKKFGYSGPVSITVYGDLKHTPDHLLRGLSSTGVNVAHTIYVSETRRHVLQKCSESESDRGESMLRFS